MGDRNPREVTVEIDRLAMGGDAVGRQRDPAGAESASDGRATFVPLAAPGERVRVRIEREKGRAAWGELTAIERPSPERVPPPCPLFGSCGGCQWQHVSIDAQRAAKKAIVERALGIAIPPVRAAGPDFGYRDRAKLTVGKRPADARVSRPPIPRRSSISASRRAARCSGPSWRARCRRCARSPAGWRPGSSSRCRRAPRGST